MEPTSVTHGPLIAGLIGTSLMIVGSIFAGGVAWGRINHRTNTIEKWVEKHAEWAEARSGVIEELRAITVRLDAIVESQEKRLDRLEKHEDIP